MSDPDLSRSFDRVAGLYEQARPTYPEQVFDRMVTFANLHPQSRLLEVGSGTGKATLPFARRGFRILCLEPGPPLAELARAAVAEFPNVQVRTTSFEDWPVEMGAFDLVFVAQAFHWLEPEQRLIRCAAALRRLGTLSVVGNSYQTTSDPAHSQIQDAHRQIAPALAQSSAREWYGSPASPVLEELRASAQFKSAEHELFHWQKSFSSHEYCELLATFSQYSTLPRAQLSALLTGVATAIDNHGGSLTVDYTTGLYLARAV